MSVNSGTTPIKMSDSDSEPASPVISQQTPVTENCRKQSTPLSDKTNETTNDLILEEVRKTNASITNFSNRMDAIESRLQSVEQQQQRAVMTPSSSGDSSAERAKNKVPTRVRVSAYKLVATLVWYIYYVPTLYL